MRAVDIMTTPVVTVTPDTPVPDIARRMVERGVSALPVVDACGELLGIVSEGDLMRRAELGTERRTPWWLVLLTDPEDRARRYIKHQGTTARDVMTSPVHTVDENASARQIAELLERHRIKRVPVVRDGKLVGIVSRANLLQGFAVRGDPDAETTRGDEELRAAVRRALSEAAGIRDELVDVTVADGTVHLWGAVPTQTELDAARVAAESSGAKRVVNHLRVVPLQIRGV